VTEGDGKLGHKRRTRGREGGRERGPGRGAGDEEEDNIINISILEKAKCFALLIEETRGGVGGPRKKTVKGN